jgi:HSP20 family protein
MSTHWFRQTTVFLLPEAEPPWRPWTPHADVYETAGGWVFKLDLAGVKPDDVQVTAEGSLLHVAGRRRDCRVEKPERYVSMEITYGRFERTFQLPVRLDRCKIESQLGDGLLLIRVSVQEASS